MALSASCIATCAIAMSQELAGPVLPEASTTLKAMTSQSVTVSARAEFDKAAHNAMTNNNSAALKWRLDCLFELEFIIPPVQCLFAQASIPILNARQATFIPVCHLLFVVCRLSFVTRHS